MHLEIEVEYLGVHGTIVNISGLCFVGNTPQLKYGVWTKVPGFSVEPESVTTFSVSGVSC